MFDSSKQFFARVTQKKHAKKKVDFDKKLVASLSGKKYPAVSQLRRLPSVLTRLERIIVLALSLCIVSATGYLLYVNVWMTAMTAPASGGTYTEGLIGQPHYLNPIFAQKNEVDADISRLVFSGLFTYTADFELAADLAESYTISEDQKQYTVVLKKNVTWHDGEPFSAQDVVFTFNAILNEEYASPLRRTFTSVSVEKKDDRTVTFTLVEPYAGFLNLLTVGIIPQHLWMDIPAKSAQNAQLNVKPIGTGIYRFKTITKETSGVVKSYTLEKNPDYYGQKPYLKELTFKFYPDYASAITALQNRSIEGIGFIPQSYAEKIENKYSTTMRKLGLSQYTALFFNESKNELLKATYIRQILEYAINKQRIIDEALDGQARVIASPILPGSLGYTEEIERHDYDQQKAIALLNENEWLYDEAASLLKKKDLEFKVTLTTADTPELIAVATRIKEDWEVVGITVALQIIPREEFEQTTIKQRAYEILLYGNVIGYDVDPFAFWHSSQREAPGVNLSMYANRKADVLLEDARKTTDEAARSAKYQEFATMVSVDIPAIFLYNPTYSYPISKSIKGFDMTKIVHPADRFLTIASWYTKTKKIFSLFK